MRVPILININNDHWNMVIIGTLNIIMFITILYIPIMGIIGDILQFQTHLDCTGYHGDISSTAGLFAAQNFFVICRGFHQESGVKANKSACSIGSIVKHRMNGDGSPSSTGEFEKPVDPPGCRWSSVGLEISKYFYWEWVKTIQNLVFPGKDHKIAGKWMFIALKMLFIGIDP